MHDFLLYAQASDSLRRLRQSMELDGPATRIDRGTRDEGASAAQPAARANRRARQST
jgi:hypothetical protein